MIFASFQARDPRLEWFQVSKFWSNIEFLRLGHTTGLTVTDVLSLIPHMKKLKTIMIPEAFHQSAVSEIKKKFNNV